MNLLRVMKHMIIRFNFIVLLCIFLISCSSFSSGFFTGKWYVEGENITLDFNKDELVLREETFGVIARASRSSGSVSGAIYKISWVSNNTLISQKYPVGGDITFKGLIDSGDGKANCLLLLPGLSFLRYYFNRSGNSKKVYYSDLLFPYESGEFLNSPDFLSLGSSYKVSLFTTLADDIGPPLSYKYLLDGNYSSYFSLKDFSDVLNNSFEFFFYDRNGKELSNDLRLRAIGFVLYPSLDKGSNLINKDINVRSEKATKEINILKDRDSFHRLRSLRLEFARGYGGGLSRSYASYSGEEMDVVLRDRGGVQVLYFFKDIYTRGVRIKPMGIYPGYIDEFRLYELIFYINDLG